MFATKFSLVFAVMRIMALPMFHIAANDKYPDDFGLKWNYSDSDQWSRIYPGCAGLRQSPVDINSNDVVQSSDELENLQFHGYNAIPVTMTIGNTGDEVQLRGFYADGETPYITGGLLTDEYIFDQLHFHWGPNDTEGSEHTIEGQGLPLEMHMVHFKREYGNEKEAEKHDDGFVTVARLFRVNVDKNVACEKFGSYLEQIKDPFTNISVDPFPLTDFDFYENDDYYTYHGSLTAPPCTEFTTWIIPSTSLKVAEEQLQRFRDIQLISGDDHNNRPVQPLNGRKLLYVRYDSSESTA